MSAWFWCLVGTAVALIAVCELVFLRDVFAGGDHGTLGAAFRMNTVFKLYYQAWLLLGIVTGPALIWLSASALRGLRAVLDSSTRTAPDPVTLESTSGALAMEGTGDPLPGMAPFARVATFASLDNSTPMGASGGAAASSSDNRHAGLDPLRLLSAGGIVLWILTCIVLVGAASIYPVLATSARTNNFTLARALDGTAYMTTDTVNRGDAQAITWLNAHVEGNPVIVEGARYDEYTHYGRVSAFTGLPTLLGWGGHEVQWRYNWLQQPGRGDVIGQRLDVVTQIYTNTNAQQVLALLHQYSVRYVYVGAAERQLYPSANLGRFATFLRVVYHSADVTIYAVP